MTSIEEKQARLDLAKCLKSVRHQKQYQRKQPRLVTEWLYQWGIYKTLLKSLR